MQKSYREMVETVKEKAQKYKLFNQSEAVSALDQSGSKEAEWFVDH